MPIVVITQGDQAAGLRAVEDELISLLEGKKVPQNVIGLLGHSGVSFMQCFVKIETEGPNFRDTLSKDVGLSPDDGMQIRAAISTMIGAWQAARQRNTAQDAEATAARLEGRQHDMPPTTGLAMQRACQGGPRQENRRRVSE